MYKYTVRKSFIKHAKRYCSTSKFVTYDWYNNNIKPLIPKAEQEYRQHGDFCSINQFTFYSEELLRRVPMGGSMFPVILFDVEKV